MHLHRGERLQGVAPRNGKERKIAKTLDKAKCKKRGGDDMSGDDDEE